jgi:hypothetical protein
MRLTSAREKPKEKPSNDIPEYFAQCLFLGELSFRYFAARINEARKILWLEQRMPLAMGGR